MDKIGHGKWGGWIVPLGVLLRLFTVITAQPGFLSISCGGKTDHTAENNITWVTDAGYIDVGQRADIDIGNVSALGSYLHSLRYFPKPLNKSCYQLPVTPNAPYLLRLWFVAGNFSLVKGNLEFSFSIETVDILATREVFSVISEQIYYEFIFVTSGRVLYICLVRTFSSYDPFISAIELRRLQDGMYQNNIGEGGRILVLQSRYDVGGNSVVRYPQDKFDRIWTPFKSSGPSRNVSSKEPISTTNTENLPPTAVMQTASVTLSETQPFLLDSTFDSAILLVLYFAEIETLNMSESRSFHVQLDGVQHSTITLMRNYSALEVTISPDTEIGRVELVESTNSTLPPIINAYEYYWEINSGRPTLSDDIYILNDIKGRFHIKDWISDPCYLIPWNGISCDDITGDIRISEIDLSGRKLTGLVPENIGDLTALVNLSLDNNAFTGPMPNFSNLIMLERLYLQNNNFNGNIEFVSSLTNLKELYLQNNNFNGNIEFVSSLTNLKELYLQNNNLNGNLKWLSEVKNLTKLYLQNNNFNGNLEWLSQLKNLKELNKQEN
uniref:Malectin-like domain-containing protein n=1 Tax=Picea sitchensis TaxID=3332 RepID=B8LLS6_PICSI|nr:unknown [Picea sitchensis]